MVSLPPLWLVGLQQNPDSCIAAEVMRWGLVRAKWGAWWLVQRHALITGVDETWLHSFFWVVPTINGNMALDRVFKWQQQFCLCFWKFLKHLDSSCILKYKSEEPTATTWQPAVLQGDSRAVDICQRRSELKNFSSDTAGSWKGKISSGIFKRTLQERGRNRCCIARGWHYSLLDSWRRITSYLLVLKSDWRSETEL